MVEADSTPGVKLDFFYSAAVAPLEPFRLTVPMAVGIKLPVTGVPASGNGAVLNLEGYEFGVASRAVGSFMGSAALSFAPPTASVPVDVTVDFFTSMQLVSREQVVITLPGFTSLLPSVAVSTVAPGAGASNVTGPGNFTATWTLATQTLTLEVKCGATIGVGDRVSLMIGAEHGFIPKRQTLNLEP